MKINIYPINREFEMSHLLIIYALFLEIGLYSLVQVVNSHLNQINS